LDAPLRAGCLPASTEQENVIRDKLLLAITAAMLAGLLLPPTAMVCRTEQSTIVTSSGSDSASR
jgi:hypothetical protein